MEWQSFAGTVYACEARDAGCSRQDTTLISPRPSRQTDVTVRLCSVRYYCYKRTGKAKKQLRPIKKHLIDSSFSSSATTVWPAVILA